MQVGRGARREGSPKPSGLQELSGRRVPCLEQGRHVVVRCPFFCTAVHTPLLSLNEEGSVWTERLRWREPSEGMRRAVCPARFGEGKERVLLCPRVCFPEGWSRRCRLLSAGSQGGPDGEALFTLLTWRLTNNSLGCDLYTCSKREQGTRLHNPEHVLRGKIL